ncbi:glucoside xylosyltransferase 2-like [Oppia nitens]|uniref:glucoside xylosyltransferase 2-like n=1 Tax=Oppia nitens TaxID=1686743 RepID=UPI0023DC860B|nr:glucoside xylosyltransferase 2-like [Oppia nitens]
MKRPNGIKNFRNLFWQLDDLDYYYKHSDQQYNSIVIAVTCCGKQSIVSQTIVMIKSMLIFSKQNIHLIIYTDVNHRQLLNELLALPQNKLDQISFEIKTAKFPNVSDQHYYRNFYLKCATQRLFYPVLLPNIDSVIHVDSDVIFMSPVEQLWKHFEYMTGEQMFAMAVDNMNPNTSWYLKIAHNDSLRIPNPTVYSFNTGIILMNLTQMRNTNFFGEMDPIFKQYKNRIHWIVNDFMTIYLAKYPNRYMNLSCIWNYLTDHCDAGQLCTDADQYGVAVLHGSRSTFVKPSLWAPHAAAFRRSEPKRFQFGY